MQQLAIQTRCCRPIFPAHEPAIQTSVRLRNRFSLKPGAFLGQNVSIYPHVIHRLNLRQNGACFERSRARKWEAMSNSPIVAFRGAKRGYGRELIRKWEINSLCLYFIETR